MNFVEKPVLRRTNHKVFMTQYKMQKQLADLVSERSSCMHSDGFTSCTNEIQQVIQVYEALYVFPQLKGAILLMVQTAPIGEGEGGHLLVLVS